MKALVVVANPCDDSFTHAAAAAAVRGLSTARHDTRVVDLYAEGFEAAMSLEERLDYHDDTFPTHPQVREYANAVLNSEALVFVYPTWWSGHPAIMKGFFDRVLTPGVAFVFDPTSKRVRPNLGHVKRIVGISTYGSPRWYVKFVNDNGRRTVMRALRMLAPKRCRTHWLALYSLDTTTQAERQDFLDRIERQMSTI